MKVSRSLGLAGGLSLAFGVASVVPAAAAPIVNDHFHTSESEVFDDFCEDMAVLFSTRPTSMSWSSRVGRTV